MTTSERIGRALYLKNKGDVWLAPLRQWVLPALGGSAALKYLGFSVTKSVLVMVGMALVWEGLSVLIGWAEHRLGATHFHYKAAAETDPYRRDSLSLLRAIRAELHELNHRQRGGR